MSKVLLSILVNNTSGVLSRISGLFSRRGYNIESLAVGETENPEFSRMTVTVQGDEYVIQQITNQVSKLEDVVSVKQFTNSNAVCRELVLVKVEVEPSARAEINAVAEIFRANIVDVSKSTVTIELTGNRNKIDAFINLLDGYVVREFVRTGLTGLSKEVIGN